MDIQIQQSQEAYERNLVDQATAISLDKDPKKYGSWRMLTPQQIKEKCSSPLKQVGINVDSLPSEVWLILRRSLVMDFSIDSDITKQLAKLFIVTPIVKTEKGKE